jgi:hypothetical protein
MSKILKALDAFIFPQTKAYDPIAWLDEIESLNNQQPAFNHSHQRGDKRIFPKLAALLPSHLGPLI